MHVCLDISFSLSVLGREKKMQSCSHDALSPPPTVGNFLGTSAAESEADCEACYPGSYCPSWAQTSVDLLCPPGWFCPMGSVSGHHPGIVHIIRCQLTLNCSNFCTLSFSVFFLNTTSVHSLVSSVSSLRFPKMMLALWG